MSDGVLLSAVPILLYAWKLHQNLLSLDVFGAFSVSYDQMMAIQGKASFGKTFADEENGSDPDTKNLRS